MGLWEGKENHSGTSSPTNISVADIIFMNPAGIELHSRQVAPGNLKMTRSTIFRRLLQIYTSSLKMYLLPAQIRPPSLITPTL